MVLLTMLHLWNGAANIKNNILVPSVSFSSPIGGTCVSSTIIMVEQC